MATKPHLRESVRGQPGRAIPSQERRGAQGGNGGGSTEAKSSTTARGPATKDSKPAGHENQGHSGDKNQKSIQGGGGEVMVRSKGAHSPREKGEERYQ